MFSLSISQELGIVLLCVVGVGGLWYRVVEVPRQRRAHSREAFRRFMAREDQELRNLKAAATTRTDIHLC